MVEGDEVFFFFFFLWASEAYAVDDGSKSLRVCCSLGRLSFTAEHFHQPQNRFLV